MASEREKIIAAARDHAAQLARVAGQTRVKPSAIPDFIRRGFEAFEHEPFTDQAAQAWVKDQQMHAWYLFDTPERRAPGVQNSPRAPATTDYSAIPNPALFVPTAKNSLLSGAR